MVPAETDKGVNIEKMWSKPTVEDFGVGAVTDHFFASGIDNYEADNPSGYGVIS